MPARSIPSRQRGPSSTSSPRTSASVSLGGDTSFWEGMLELLRAKGAAAVLGVQRHVMACVTHVAWNSIESSRFALDVRVGERALHEVFLAQFAARYPRAAAGRQQQHVAGRCSSSQSPNRSS